MKHWIKQHWILTILIVLFVYFMYQAWKLKRNIVNAAGVTGAIGDSILSTITLGLL